MFGFLGHARERRIETLEVVVLLTLVTERQQVLVAGASARPTPATQEVSIMMTSATSRCVCVVLVHDERTAKLRSFVVARRNFRSNCES